VGWPGEASPGRLAPEDRRIEIEGGYIADHHRYLYNDIFIGEALDTLGRLGDSSYDLALVADVLEHFKKDRGVRFLREAMRVSRWVLVSVPEDVVPEKIARTNIFHKPWNNKYEMHRSHWDRQDFEAISPGVRFIPCRGFIIASLGGTQVPAM
jgi:hypothetical protein